MADRIVLVRHAEAEACSDPSEDLGRRLTPAGRRSCVPAMARMASLLLRDAEPDEVVVWTSEAVRAREVAGIASDALGLDRAKVRVVDALTCGDGDALLGELDAADGTVVAVGHNPFAERLTERLCGTRLHFGKAASACLVPGKGDGDWTLSWFLQGPDARRWETLASIERALERAGRDVADAARRLRRHPDDPEALHQYRISLRVARSLLLFARPYLRRTSWRRAYDALRELQAPTSAVREYDVMFSELEGATTADFADRDELLAACAHSRAAARGRLVRTLGKDKARHRIRDASRLMGTMAFRHPVEERGLSASELRARYLDQVRRYEEDLSSCDFRDVEATHAIRKRSKQLRYVARELADVLGGDCGRLGERARSVQDLLGELCDARTNLGLAQRLLRADATDGGDGARREAPTYAEVQQLRIEEALARMSDDAKG